VAEGFTLSFQLFAGIVASGTGTFRSGAGAVIFAIIIIIIIIVPGNLIIQLRPAGIEAVLAHCLVFCSLQS
jgi:hypothetical protein